MKISYMVVVALTSVTMFSCVSSKKFKAEQAKYAELDAKHTQLQNDLKACDDAKAEEARKRAGLETDVANLNKQLELVKANNTSALKQLQDLSVISSTQAESIKKSMDNLGLKDAYIQDLQTQMAKKDSLNMALVMNLKGAIGNMDDQDINIKVDKGVVFIDISDKLLFKSGSYSITPKAQEVLGKVATVLKAQPELEFMVEGHTDNAELKGNIGPMKDNWDLSVMRATSVVRVLQKKYGLDPAKITAAGRGEFLPVADNSTAEGKAANRRTRILILPQLDQFYKLLEKKQ
ncbi:OmpA/MotB family protein [Flavihumibacter profundi]|uniref:OmpA/MotB family protein n=1 Tax=Flavihumibacter profundi TaxID=2716883 RepID=UPI001CC470FC|nr:OmpA family protein [Flavihumibacter profundi]MBZ5857858.1 OmpA family protein [Flavihumibacter profundi]